MLEIENAIAKWKSIFHHTGKNKHFKLCSRHERLLFERLNDHELEQFRSNRFARLSDGKNCMAMEEFCEELNKLEKHTKCVSDNKSLQCVSSLMFIFRKAHAEMFNTKESKSSVKSKCAINRKLICDVLQQANIFENSERSIHSKTWKNVCLEFCK